MRMRTPGLAACAVALLACLPAAAAAEVITDRAIFESLVESPTVDRFEGMPVTNGQALVTSLTTLDHTTRLDNIGPGLVEPGATYQFLRAPLTWLGDMYAGYPMSRTIIAWNGTEGTPQGSMHGQNVNDPMLSFSVYIIYDTPAQLVGMDLLRWDILGLVTLEIYDQWGTLIEIVDADVPDAGVPTFIGYRFDDGIGSIVVKNTRFPAYWSPSIDNHIYGALNTTPVQQQSWGTVKKRYR